MLKKIILLFLLFTSISLAASVTTFVSPDSGYATLSKFIRENDNFLIAVYTFDNYDIAKLLQGKNFTLIVEKSPVGGISDDEKFILCTFDTNDNVYTYAKRFMHAKYIVSDDKVLVTTENFGYSGFAQGYGNRGFGAIVEDSSLANEFTEIFYEDLDKSAEFKCDDSYKITERAPKLYIKQFDTARFVGSAEAIFAPAAVDDVVALINTSKDRIYVAQAYIHKEWGTKSSPTRNEFLETVIDRARAGAEVRILLDSSWYNVDDDGKSNRDTINYVNIIAKRENLNMQARLIRLDDLNLKALHGKLVLVDDAVFVSSINWGEHSATNNREAGVIIRGDAASYYERIFLSDFGGAREPTLPEGQFLAVIIISVALIVVIVLFLR